MPGHYGHGKKKKPMKGKKRGGKKKKSMGLTAKQKKLPMALQRAILKKKRGRQTQKNRKEKTRSYKQKIVCTSKG